MSYYVDKSRLSPQEWAAASESNNTSPENKCKEKNLTLFFRGAIFEFSYNQDKKILKHSVHCYMI